jgi:hypothetical protein
VIALVAALAAATAAQSPLEDLFEEFPEVAMNCELPEAALARFTDEGRNVRLLLPRATYRRRGEPAVAGRIACIEHWARERGLRLRVYGLRR